jgi:hypothetical protein
LHPGNLHPDAPKEAFLHHAMFLRHVTETLGGLDFEPAFRQLSQAYEASLADWPIAAQAASVNQMGGAWIAPLLSGLRRYAELEGWA